MKAEYFYKNQSCNERLQTLGHYKRRDITSNINEAIESAEKCPRMHQGSTDYRTSELDVYVCIG